MHYASVSVNFVEVSILTMKLRTYKLKSSKLVGARFKFAVRIIGGHKFLHKSGYSYIV